MYSRLRDDTRLGYLRGTVSRSHRAKVFVREIRPAFTGDMFCYILMFSCFATCHAACLLSGPIHSLLEIYSIYSRSKATINDEGDVVLVPWEKTAGRDLRLQWQQKFLGDNNEINTMAFSSKANPSRYLSISATGNVTTTTGVRADRRLHVDIHARTTQTQNHVLLFDRQQKMMASSLERSWCAMLATRLVRVPGGALKISTGTLSLITWSMPRTRRLIANFTLRPPGADA